MNLYYYEWDGDKYLGEDYNLNPRVVHELAFAQFFSNVKYARMWLDRANYSFDGEWSTAKLVRMVPDKFEYVENN